MLSMSMAPACPTELSQRPTDTSVEILKIIVPFADKTITSQGKSSCACKIEYKKRMRLFVIFKTLSICTQCCTAYLFIKFAINDKLATLCAWSMAAAVFASFAHAALQLPITAQLPQCSCDTHVVSED